MSCYTEDLMNAVAQQIAEDIINNDYLAIHELLENLTAQQLKNYLPEDSVTDLAKQWNLGVDTIQN